MSERRLRAGSEAGDFSAYRPRPTLADHAILVLVRRAGTCDVLELQRGTDAVSASRHVFSVFKDVRVLRKNDGAGATHGAPVVSERGAADEANLVVLPMGTAMRPGKTVRAEVLDEPLEETGHTCRTP